MQSPVGLQNVNRDDSTVGRFAGFGHSCRRVPGVPLRFTPGFMLSPAPQAGRQYRSFESSLPHSFRLFVQIVTLSSGTSRSGGHCAGPYHSLGETLHLLQLRAALQQKQINAGSFEFRDAFGYLVWRAD